MKPTSLIFVLYDGIQNSVFNGQILQPLLNRLAEHPEQEITLISFESHSTAAQAQLPQAHERLTYIILKKIPFIGSLSLFYAARQLRALLQQYASYEIVARGPFAGLICLKAAQTKNCTHITIQARGLLAQEYSYICMQAPSALAAWWRNLRYRQFLHVEHKAYAHDNTHIPITIQAVSTALRSYLIMAFDADQQHIQIADHDIPSRLAHEQLQALRTNTRQHLNIPLEAHVYCYNGSIKPWQCPERIAHYLGNKLDQEQATFLLVLTQDTHAFKSLFKKHNMPPEKIRVVQVPHRQMYEYLAAADVGLMFREPHIVNWVSRPTKALEYQAAGLTVLHNNTVAWLIKS